MNILILEDEPLLLEKYESYAREVFHNVFAHASVDSAREDFLENPCEVILADHQLPDGDGLNFITEMTDSLPYVVGILITAYSKEKLAIESLNRGIFRYLEKPAGRREIKSILLKSLEEARRRGQYKALEGRFLMSPKTREKLIQDYEISSRELEVIDAILIHTKNRPVAQSLFISEGTVKNHLSHIFQKLHIHGKDELKEFVYQLNQRLGKLK